MTALPLLALGLVQAAPRDTVFLVQAKPGWQSWIEALAAVSTIVVALALLAIGVGVLVAAKRVKELTKTVEAHAQKLRVDLAPAIRNVTAVSENANFVSKTVKEDVERLSRTVTSAQDGVKRAAAAAEEKVGELNALLGVVQEEAESLFIGSASSLRGLRAGAQAFRRLRGEEDGWDEEEEDYDASFAGDPDVDGAYGELEDDAYARGVADDEDYADERTDDEVSDEELELRIARREARDIDPDRVF